MKKTTFSEDYELEMMEIQELAFDQKNSVIYSKFASKFDMEIFLSHFQWKTLIYLLNFYSIQSLSLIIFMSILWSLDQLIKEQIGITPI